MSNKAQKIDARRKFLTSWLETLNAKPITGELKEKASVLLDEIKQDAIQYMDVFNPSDMKSVRHRLSHESGTIDLHYQGRHIVTISDRFGRSEDDSTVFGYIGTPNSELNRLMRDEIFEKGLLIKSEDGDKVIKPIRNRDVESFELRVNEFTDQAQEILSLVTEKQLGELNIPKFLKKEEMTKGASHD